MCVVGKCGRKEERVLCSRSRFGCAIMLLPRANRDDQIHCRQYARACGSVWHDPPFSFKGPKTSTFETTTTFVMNNATRVFSFDSETGKELVRRQGKPTLAKNLREQRTPERRNCRTNSKTWVRTGWTSAFSPNYGDFKKRSVCSCERRGWRPTGTLLGKPLWSSRVFSGSWNMFDLAAWCSPPCTHAAL